MMDCFEIVGAFINMYMCVCVCVCVCVCKKITILTNGPVRGEFSSCQNVKNLDMGKQAHIGFFLIIGYIQKTKQNKKNNRKVNTEKYTGPAIPGGTCPNRILT